jgi:hypothetical protein
MIVFDLKCEGGHVFEAWFGSSADYDEQRSRELVRCPLCETLKVEKAVMLPRIGGGDARAVKAKSMLAALAEAQQRVLDKSDYVGERFAEEARAIHLGEADARSIYGKATKSEAKALGDEGIAVAPLPLPFVPPEQRN